MACDATRVVMHHAGNGPVLDVGRRTRTIPPALRRALHARDRGCRFPGCGVRHAQGHHLHHWANGGPTRLDNLALLCRRHHRAVHEDGYRVERDADGTLHFSTPTGRPIPEVPASPNVPTHPTEALVAAHRARGLAIDARTGCPSWGGERLDVGWAIGVLHPACQPAAPRLASRSA
jgi:HNH endonuclease